MTGRKGDAIEHGFAQPLSSTPDGFETSRSACNWLQIAICPPGKKLWRWQLQNLNSRLMLCTTKSIEKSVAFYRDTLGFHFTARDDVARLDLAGVLFELVSNLQTISCQVP